MQQKEQWFKKFNYENGIDLPAFDEVYIELANSIKCEREAAGEDGILKDGADVELALVMHYANDILAAKSIYMDESGKERPAFSYNKNSLKILSKFIWDLLPSKDSNEWRTFDPRKLGSIGDISFKPGASYEDDSYEYQDRAVEIISAAVIMDLANKAGVAINDAHHTYNELGLNVDYDGYYAPDVIMKAHKAVYQGNYEIELEDLVRSLAPNDNI